MSDSWRTDKQHSTKRFEDLCDTLLLEYPFLYVSVEYYRNFEWRVRIYSSNPDMTGDEVVELSHGSSNKMTCACNAAVDNYDERQRVKRRKQELLANPDVVEALSLLGVAIPEQK